MVTKPRWIVEGRNKGSVSALRASLCMPREQFMLPVCVCVQGRSRSHCFLAKEDARRSDDFAFQIR